MASNRCSREVHASHVRTIVAVPAAAALVVHPADHAVLHVVVAAQADHPVDLDSVATTTIIRVKRVAVSAAAMAALSPASMIKILMVYSEAAMDSVVVAAAEALVDHSDVSSDAMDHRHVVMVASTVSNSYI